MANPLKDGLKRSRPKEYEGVTPATKMGGSVDQGADRGDKPAPSPKTLGPRET